jgi:hypothetical protein
MTVRIGRKVHNPTGKAVAVITRRDFNSKAVRSFWKIQSMARIKNFFHLFPFGCLVMEGKRRFDRGSMSRDRRRGLSMTEDSQYHLPICFFFIVE